MYKRIRELREERYLTISDLSAYLDCNKATYLKYENGSIRVRISVFIRLANLYNTSIDYILELTDKREPHKRAVIPKQTAQ